MLYLIQFVKGLKFRDAWDEMVIDDQFRLFRIVAAFVLILLIKYVILIVLICFALTMIWWVAQAISLHLKQKPEE